jgi:hypothetical protein
MNFIKKYFLRQYAVELRKGSARTVPPPLSLGPYGEAVLRTVVLVVVAMGGLGASILAIALNGSVTAGAFLFAYRNEVLMSFGVTCVIAAYVLVNRWVREFKGSPQSASAFGSERDRWISVLQLCGVFACSLAAPVLTTILMR